MKENTNNIAQMPHHVIIEGRERMSIAGVEDVESFDEDSIICTTTRGTLVVKGHGLHIDKLNIEGGELNVEGAVDSLEYEDSTIVTGGFFSRLFR